MAEKFGNEEGNESQVGPEMFLPELIIPDSSAPAGTELAATEIAEPITDNTIIEQAAADTALAETAEANLKDDADAAATEPLVDPELNATPTGAEVANLAPATVPPTANGVASSMSSSATSIWIVGAGVAVALIVLFGLTFVVLRPR